MPGDDQSSASAASDASGAAKQQLSPKSGKKNGISAELLAVMRKAFVNLCSQPSGVLFECKSLKVGVKHEYKGNDGRMAIFFQANKDTKPLQHFSVSVEKVACMRMETTASPTELLADGGCTLEPDAQVRLIVFVELISTFEKSPSLKICFESDGEQYEYPLLLPIVAACFPPQKQPSGKEVGTGAASAKATNGTDTKPTPKSESKSKEKHNNGKSKSTNIKGAKIAELAAFLDRPVPSSPGKKSKPLRGSASVGGSTPATMGDLRIDANGKKERKSPGKKKKKKIKADDDDDGSVMEMKKKFEGLLAEMSTSSSAGSVASAKAPSRKGVERSSSSKQRSSSNQRPLQAPLSPTREAKTVLPLAPFTSPVKGSSKAGQPQSVNLSLPFVTPSRKPQKLSTNQFLPQPQQQSNLQRSERRSLSPLRVAPKAIPAQTGDHRAISPPSSRTYSPVSSPERDRAFMPRPGQFLPQAPVSPSKGSQRHLSPPPSPSRERKNMSQKPAFQKSVSTTQFLTNGRSYNKPESGRSPRRASANHLSTELANEKRGGSRSPRRASTQFMTSEFSTSHKEPVTPKPNRLRSSSTGIAEMRLGEKENGRGPGPPGGNKVPKVVKSLQSGCFMSAQHVPSILTECLQLIRDKPDFQLELGESKAAIPSIIKMMNRFEEDAVVQELSCSVLQCLCETHDKIRASVTEEGGLKAVLVALLKHEQSMAVQIQGMAALAGLALNAENQVSIPDLSGFEVLKTCMEAYQSNGDLQTQACRVIAALSQNPRNSKALGAKGLSKAVVEIMRDHPSNETLQCHACGAVRALTYENDINCGSLASAGVLDTTVAAMKAFEANAMLQAGACGILWNLTEGQTQNAKMIVTYYNNDCVRSILTALKKHNLDAAVQEAGCGALKNLTENDDYAVAVGREGAIVPILNAMRQHTSTKSVQAQGCGALCNLASVEDHKGPILNAGGIGMIVYAMKELVESAEVQKQACRALRNLSTDEQNKVSIAASGGIAAMLAAMERHEENAGVQVLALGAISQLVVLQRNRANISSNDGVRIIENAMAKHPNGVYVQETGKEILAQLNET